MTKKTRSWQGAARTSASLIKSINKDTFASALCPTNIEDQKRRFLKLGLAPQFLHKGSTDELEELFSKPRSEIRFDLLGEAIHILNTVKEKYGDAESVYTEMYGNKITKEEATDIIVEYLKEHNLDGQMSIIWCADLPCSGRMMWQGPHAKYRRPEARKYSMWIKDASDNNFLRSQGIRCLADHEIGTHFFRSYNDGLQPWFADRTKFGVRSVSDIELLRSEEGLAAINTVLNAKIRYLWGPALLYYIACKATEMTFKQLFEHLALFVANPDWRWRHCVRVKRGLLNPNDIGGYGKDQCYFEGAVTILRNVDNIDFNLFMSGKLCYDEVSRVKKLARLSFIQMPAFMKNQEKYKRTLKQIAHMNGLHMKHDKISAPAAYLRQLKNRRIGGSRGTKKVSKKGIRGSVSAVNKLVEQDSDKKIANVNHGVFTGSFEEKDDSENTSEDDIWIQSMQATIDTKGRDLVDNPAIDKHSLEKIRRDSVEKERRERVGREKERKERANKDRKEEKNKEIHSGAKEGRKKSDVSDHSHNCKVKSIRKTEVKKPEAKISLATETSSTELRKIDSTESQDSTRDWENDCPKSIHRCVSRASVQNYLSNPSSSLSSRNKNIDSKWGVMQRPQSSTLPNRSSSFFSSMTELQVPETDGDVGAGQTTPVNKVLPASTPYNTYNTSSLSDSHSVTNLLSTYANSYHPHHAGVSGAHKGQPGSASLSNIPGQEQEGFLYPDTDLLTDGMMAINDSANPSDLILPTNTLTNQIKLLRRRVKSAAKILPSREQK